MRQLRIGISASSELADLGGTLWNNGINQNILYLAMVLQRLPNVSDVVIVNCPGGERPNLLGDQMGIPTVQSANMLGAVDVLIEMGVRFDQALLATFRQNGGRVVSYVAGNSFVMDFECLASGVPYGELMPEAMFDASWITPQHWHMNAGYNRLLRSPNTVKAPHVWHPRCFLAAADQTRNNPYFRSGPRERPWRVGVFDPTFNVVKTFHLPFLACEQAHRRSPHQIEKISMFGIRDLAGQPHLEEFVACSTLAEAKKVYVEDRQIVVGMLGKHVDVVLTHQWENNLNYLYWDVLYSNHPLVHNSEAVPQVGYYFPAFDPVKGGEALLEAINGHASRPKEKRAEELAYLWSLNPENPEVQKVYQGMLDDLYG